MQISALTPKTHYNFQIFITGKPSQETALNLTQEERDYANQLFKEDKVVFISRLPNWLVLVKMPQDLSHQALEKLRLAGTKITQKANQENASAAAINSSSTQATLAVAEGMALRNYQFLKYFTQGKPKPNSLATLAVAEVDSQALNLLNAVLAGTQLARNLVNEPLSYLTATQLAQAAQAAGKKFGFTTEVLDKKKIESLKMGGLLAVNKGSQDPPTFTIMEYKPKQAVNKKPIVLVGKGVVYDTGGMSLKPTAGSMDSMKSDMAGSAAAIGTLSAVAHAQLPVHVIGLVPATDNRPGENAYVPGDVITMYDGSTVEVLNTDAEGRMLLADALAYAKKYDPELVVDLATLTGSAAMAIGKYGVVGMGTASNEVFANLEEAGNACYERLARFPFWEEYRELLKSDIADMKNIGGREAGAITAGKFLEHFTNYPWVHLDIAGPAFLNSAHEYRPQGGTGVGVRLLFEFLKRKK
jgi:leucyl aminopeptidase